MDRTRLYRLLFPSLAKKQVRDQHELQGFLARGKTASAEVLDAAPGHYKGSGGLRTRRMWTLSLRVRPAQGSEFEVTLEHGFLTYYSPVAGQTLDVVYDPDDRVHVIVYPPDPEPTDANLPSAARGGAGTYKVAGAKVIRRTPRESESPPSE